MLLTVIVVGFSAAFSIAWTLNWIELIPWRRSAGKHWTERARQLYPASISGASHGFYLGVMAALTTQFVGGLSSNHWLAAGLSAWLGGTLGRYAITREARPEIRFLAWLRYLVFFMLIRSIYFGLILVAALLMPADFGWKTWLLGGGVLAFMLAYNFGLHRKLLAALGMIRPAPPALDALAHQAALRGGASLRKVWIYPHPSVFAFAYPTTREMIFSSELFERLTPDEVRSISAHEAAHLTESRWTLASRVVAALSLYPFIYVRPLTEAYGPSSVGYLFIAILLVALLFSRVGRKMEVRADKKATEQTSDPLIYARALEKVYEINQMPLVLSSRQRHGPHPDGYVRLLAAGYTPDYLKPAKPKSWLAIWRIEGYIAIAMFYYWFVEYFASYLKSIGIF